MILFEFWGDLNRSAWLFNIVLMKQFTNYGDALLVPIKLCISNKHSYHFIIYFSSLMICIQRLVLVWVLWISYGLVQVYFLMQYKGWWMVNARLCETARAAFFSARPRLFWSLDCETEIQTPHWLCKKFVTARRSEPHKKRDCETHEIWPKFCESFIFSESIHHP